MSDEADDHDQAQLNNAELPVRSFRIKLREKALSTPPGETRAPSAHDQAKLDEAVEESMPASDTPSVMRTPKDDAAPDVPPPDEPKD